VIDQKVSRMKKPSINKIKKKPNILFLANSLYGGGIQEFIFNITKNISVVQPVILAPRELHQESFDRNTQVKVERQTINNYTIFSRFLYKVTNITGFQSIYRSLQYKPFIKGLLKSYNIKMIHCSHIYLAPLAYFIFRKWGIPYIVYAYGKEFVINNVCRSNPLMYRIMKNVLNNASAIISNCDFTSGLIKQWGIDSGNIMKIPNGVDHEYFNPKEISYNSQFSLLANKKNIILTVGRLIERKGHDTVIRALAQIRQTNPNIFYVIIGEGPQEKYLKMLANQLNVDDIILFAGRVSNKTLLKYYRSCTFFIMLSRVIGRNHDVEGMPLVYLQASACAKPTIGGRTGGVEEAVINNITGYTIDPEDIQECVFVMNKLINEKNIASKLGKNGRDWIEKKMNWKLGTRQLDQLISIIIIN